MKARFVQNGDYIDYTAATDVAAGDVLVIGTIVGVANRPIPSGRTGAIAIEGVFEFAKAASTAIAAGAVVYWDAANSVVTTTSSENTALGKAVAAAAADDTLVRVKLG